MVNAFSGKTGSFSKVNIKTLQNQAFTTETNFRKTRTKKFANEAR